MCYECVTKKRQGFWKIAYFVGLLWVKIHNPINGKVFKEYNSFYI